MANIGLRVRFGSGGGVSLMFVLFLTDEDDSWADSDAIGIGIGEMRHWRRIWRLGLARWQQLKW